MADLFEVEGKCLISGTWFQLIVKISCYELTAERCQMPAKGIGQ